ncbi:hypothetical protein [Thalassovita mediterranea]|jgi:hypothetical protein|uniref:Uncharacterized protein n=1 Tax=Thalassovita mediterranea TaxID=340021 RepID=A0A0P1H263_9RHOB|nr:hypothetical protein [Thalassovita mediterranea]CUH83423.1 hypothetical protein TM5383_00611 [Thalassovita mediterranea]SIS34862.1 hypothetical protein SAMN05421685_1139 [Thalassovita mediterranea]
MILLRRLAPFGYLALQLGAAYLLALYLVIAGFGLRDSFCYPDYPTTIAKVLCFAIGICALTHLPGFAILKWVFVISPHKAAIPCVAVTSGIILLFGGDLFLRALNETHCAVGPWGLQDNSIIKPIWLEALIEYGMKIAALLWLLSTVWLFIVSLKCAFTTQDA